MFVKYEAQKKDSHQKQIPVTFLTLSKIPG
jgi:hypothetical protein